MSTLSSIYVRDLRESNWFWVHKIIQKQYARLIGSSAISLYNSLACHANSGGECWPSKAHLAEELGVTARTIQRLVRVLEQYHLINVIYKNGKGNIYQLLKVEPVGETLAPPGGGDMDVQGGETSVSGEGRHVCLPNKNKEQEPINNNSDGDDKTSLAIIEDSPYQVLWKDIANTQLRTKLKENDAAAKRLEDLLGLDSLKEMLLAVRLIRQDKFAGRNLQFTLVNYLGLEKRLEEVEAYMRGKVDNHQITNSYTDEERVFFGLNQPA